MDKTLTCDCGFIARAPDDVGLAHEGSASRLGGPTGCRSRTTKRLPLLFHAELAEATAIPARSQTATEREEQ